MKTAITFEIDTDDLTSFTDQHLADLWHVAQANPAPYGNRDACRVAEYIGREIIHRFLSNTAPNLWSHQGAHINSDADIPSREKLTDLIERAEGFISGFEGDETQDGIDLLLSDLRTVVAKKS